MDVRDGLVILERLGELERTLDVLPGSLEVAVPPVAARPPLEDVRPQAVARHPGAVGELEPEAEVLQRRLDRVQLVPTAAEPVEHLGAVDIGEHLALGDAARPLEPVERRPKFAEVHARPALDEEGAEKQLRRLRRPPKARDEPDRVLVALLLDGLLGLREQLVGLAVVGLGDAVGEVERIDAQPFRQPLDRVRRRPRLAGLDLADVLLRDAGVRELALRQAPGVPETAHAFAEAPVEAGGLRDRLCGHDAAWDHWAPTFSVCRGGDRVHTAIGSRHTPHPGYTTVALDAAHLEG